MNYCQRQMEEIKPLENRVFLRSAIVRYPGRHMEAYYVIDSLILVSVARI